MEGPARDAEGRQQGLAPSFDVSGRAEGGGEKIDDEHRPARPAGDEEASASKKTSSPPVPISTTRPAAAAARGQQTTLVSKSYMGPVKTFSINYGDYEDEEEGGSGSGTARRMPPPSLTRKAITQSPLRPRVPLAQKEHTWRHWSPVRERPPAMSGDASGGSAKRDRETPMRPRRSMDLSEMRLQAAGAGAGTGMNKGEKEKKENKGKELETKEDRTKQETAAKGEHEIKAAKTFETKNESESENDSGNSSSDSEGGHSHAKRPLIKKKRKVGKRGKKHKREHSHVVDLETQLGHSLDEDDYEHLPIYLERVRKVLPVMAIGPQVLGFIAWQIVTFVLGLSLGIFLSGILPGYDIADVGINSHWWIHDMKKPPFQPPDDMLAPMWITTLSLAAVGMWFVWRRGGWKWNKLAMALFLVHLLIFQQLLLALLLSVLGWVVMLVCLIAFSKRSYIATGLLSFAFLWKCFVVIDSMALWWLNSSDLASADL